MRTTLARPCGGINVYVNEINRYCGNFHYRMMIDLQEFGPGIVPVYDMGLISVLLVATLELL